MNVGIAFTFCSYFFICLLTVVYFSKARVKSIENKIYSGIIISSLLGSTIGVPCYYFMKIYEQFPLANFIFSRLYLVYLITWLTLFCLYIVVISLPNFNLKKYKKSLVLAYLISLVLVMTLPFYYKTGEVVYSYGPAANFVYIISSILILPMLYCLIKNIKQIKQKKYYPLIFFIIFGTAIMIIQKLNPGLLFLTFGEAFITFLMYFTMENPDVKMINELNKNRLLVNQTMEEKSNFLFLASNQIKSPINNILELSNQTMVEKDEEIVLENLKQINNLSHSLAFMVENVMDMSTLTIKNIKVVNTKYNLVNLINKIKLQKEKEVNENIDFRVILSPNIPEYLYGDYKLLEQVIMSILDNAIKYTKVGFIELNISTIQKYDMCRLMITVEDSGIGMSIDKVNDLLMIDEELDQNDLKRLETKNVDINTIKKIISKMGGYFTIKSESEKGTEIKMVIDQKIKVADSLKINKYLKEDSILVASKDNELLKNVTKLVEKKGYSVQNSIYASDVIDRVRVKEQYSCIILDDDLDKRALEIFQELKKYAKFKIPVIIMINKDVEFIKEHFLEDGFADYILKDDLVNEINRIFE